MSFNISTKLNNLYQLILDVSNNIPPASTGLPSATEYGEYALYNGTDWITQGGSTTSGNTVKLGRNAGFNSGNNSVLLGNGAGFDSSNNVIAIGNLAGSESASSSISIGSGSGVVGKQASSISIGQNSAYFNQAENSIGIGVAASQNYPKEKSISLGYFAGRNYNGVGSLCLGNNTESTNYDGSVVISGGTTGLSADGSNRCFVSPIRNASNSNVLMYNSSTKEVTYSIPPSPSFGAAVVRELTTAGSNSPVSFTNNVRTLRQINEIQFNTLGITLSLTPNWAITIPTAGTYIFRARGTYGATRTGSNPFAISSKLFIRDETNGLDDFIVGENSRWLCFDNVSSAYPFNFQTECNGIKTITGLTTISLRQVCNDALSSGTKNGGIAVSLPSGAGVPEIYATLEIQRIA